MVAGGTGMDHWSELGREEGGGCCLLQQKPSFLLQHARACNMCARTRVSIAMETHCPAYNHAHLLAVQNGGPGERQG